MSTGANKSRHLSQIRNAVRKWLPASPLHQDFWILYASSLFVDLGLCLYFFMFNLFLVEHHFTERDIGFITAALTLGTLVGTVPVSLISSHFGLRPTLLLYVLIAPLCLVLRTLFFQMPLQLALAFLSGAIMSIWMVCFSPLLAKVTGPENRTFGFSLFTATGIGSGALAGLIGGYLPGLVHRLGQRGAQEDGLRIVLFLACATIASAVIPLRRLRLSPTNIPASGARVFNGFILRFLIAIAVWNFSICFFTPFASVYLSKQIGLPLSSIGAIIAASQLIQVGAVLVAPALYRRTGIIAGIAITQVCTACSLWALGHASGSRNAIGFYLALTAFQWMSGPGISSLLMNRTPEENRSHAAAMHGFVNLASQASAAVLAGKAFEQHGYSGPLSVNAGIAVLAGVAMYTLLKHPRTAERTVPASRRNNAISA